MIRRRVRRDGSLWSASIVLSQNWKIAKGRRDAQEKSLWVTSLWSSSILAPSRSLMSQQKLSVKVDKLRRRGRGGMVIDVSIIGIMK